MASVVASLDWERDVGQAPLLDPLGELVRARFGDGALRWVAGAVEESISTIQDKIQDILAPRALFRLLTQRIAVDILFDLVGCPAGSPDPVVIEPQLAADFVGRGISLADVTGGLRHMQRDWLVRLTEAALAVDPDAARLSPGIAASVTTTMDTWVEAMTAAMIDRQRQVAEAAEIRARAAIEALIAGHSVDIAAASSLLRVPLSGSHVCCVIGASSGVVVDRARVDVLVSALTRIAGNHHVLRHETSRGKTYLWLTAERVQVRVPTEGLEVPAPFVIGIGEPHSGAEGFRRSFIEADDAVRFALRLGAGGALAYRQQALAITMSQNDERCRWFVDLELGELAGEGEDMAENRNALRAFFAARMRIAPAAEMLFVHRNTLIHRLGRIEAMLGHPLGERTAELQAALKLAEVYSRPTPKVTSA